MTYSLMLGFLWLFAANLIAMLPSRDHHWRNAYLLITLGIPLLGWITFQNGPILGLLFLAGGASVLRWPVYFVARWAKSVVRRPPTD
jgi:uncharacterized membrane protein